MYVTPTSTSPDVPARVKPRSFPDRDLMSHCLCYLVKCTEAFLTLVLEKWWLMLLINFLYC